MSKAKLKKISKLEKEYQDLLRKREEAEKEAFYSIGELVYKHWNITELDDYDLLEEFIKDKSKEFDNLNSTAGDEKVNDLNSNQNEVDIEDETNKED